MVPYIFLYYLANNIRDNKYLTSVWKSHKFVLYRKVNEARDASHFFKLCDTRAKSWPKRLSQQKDRKVITLRFTCSLMAKKQFNCRITYWITVFGARIFKCVFVYCIDPTVCRQRNCIDWFLVKLEMAWGHQACTSMCMCNNFWLRQILWKLWNIHRITFLIR